MRNDGYILLIAIFSIFFIGILIQLANITSYIFVLPPVLVMVLFYYSRNYYHGLKDTLLRFSMLLVGLFLIEVAITLLYSILKNGSVSTLFWIILSFCFLMILSGMYILWSNLPFIKARIIGETDEGFRQFLLKGFNSGEGVPLDEKDWEAKKARLINEFKNKQSKRSDS